MQRRLIAPLIVVLASLNAACRKETAADTSAVETANTSIKTQGQIGFCWAYAAVAMIESRYKQRTGKDIDLSEEALGFFHYAETLQSFMNSKLKRGELDAVVYMDPGVPPVVQDT